MIYLLLTQTTETTQLNNYQIYTLIISSISSLATIAAFLTCIFTFRTIHPHIKIYTEKNSPGNNIFYSDKEKGVTIVIFSATNNSPIQGIIDEAYIKLNKKIYLAMNSFTIYNNIIDEIKIRDHQNNLINSKKFRLKLPLKIPPFSTVRGYFTFFDFPIGCQTNTFNAKLFMKVNGNNLCRKFNLTFFRTATKQNNIQKTC